jgi:hypothetical protein
VEGRAFGLDGTPARVRGPGTIATRRANSLAPSLSAAPAEKLKRIVACGSSKRKTGTCHFGLPLFRSLFCWN